MFTTYIISVFVQRMRNLAETNTIFIMEKDKQCLACHWDWFYVSDIFSFALLSLDARELEVYYYDFEQKFTCNKNIEIPDYTSREIKLCCRCIWIVTYIYDDSYEGCLIDAIKVINEREWCHVRTNICSPISLEMVFPGITGPFRRGDLSQAQALTHAQKCLEVW